MSTWLLCIATHIWSPGLMPWRGNFLICIFNFESIPANIPNSQTETLSVIVWLLLLFFFLTKQTFQKISKSCVTKNRNAELGDGILKWFRGGFTCLHLQKATENAETKLNKICIIFCCTNSKQYYVPLSKIPERGSHPVFALKN